MPESGNVDVSIRAGDKRVLVSQILEKLENKGSQIVNGGAGFTGDETLKFVLVDGDGSVVLDAVAATLVSNPLATISYLLDSNIADGGNPLAAGRYTYYWIVENLAGGGERLRTDDNTLAIGSAADTYTG